MYDQFYGFSERPFSLLPDPDFLFLSDKHRTALDTLELAIFNHSGFCVISGAIGAGKTTLVRELLNRLNSSVQVGLVSNTHPSFGELMQWVMAAYGLPCGTDDRLELHRRFMDYVIQRYADGKHTLLIIDEAQNLSMDALEELRMLSNVNSEKDLVLQIIMIGQSELRDKLRRPELAQFAQRISIDFYLGGLTPDETALYIQHRVTHAGGPADLFTAEACRRVFDFSKGIPRVINRLCDLSLVYGYAQQREQIGADLVEAVEREQHAGESLEAARLRAATPASPVRPVVAAMAEATDRNPAADALIGGMDSILAAGVAPAGDAGGDAAVEPVAVSSGPVDAPDAPRASAASEPPPESSPVASPEPAMPDTPAAERPKPASELHTLVVKAEKAAGARGERGAFWLFLSVVVMVGLTAWVSRDSWLPAVQDAVATGAPAVDVRAQDAARLAKQQAEEKARQAQARKARAQQEEAARLAKQRAEEKAKQEQARKARAQQDEAARLAKQRAEEKAKQEQARKARAQQDEAARLAKQRAEEKAKQEQARKARAQQDEVARLAKQRAEEKARQEQARKARAQQEEATRLAKQRAREKAKQEQARQQAIRKPVLPAAWTDTPEWSEEDDDELIDAPGVEAVAAEPTAPAAPETPVAVTDPATAAPAAAAAGDEDATPEPDGFSSNPCNGPTARFLSTCR